MVPIFSLSNCLTDFVVCYLRTKKLQSAAEFFDDWFHRVSEMDRKRAKSSVALRWNTLHLQAKMNGIMILWHFLFGSLNIVLALCRYFSWFSKSMLSFSASLNQSPQWRTKKSNFSKNSNCSTWLTKIVNEPFAPFRSCVLAWVVSAFKFFVC